LRPKTANPRASSPSTTAARVTSIATATRSDWPPLCATSHSASSSSASSACATRRCPRSVPSAFNTRTSCHALPQSMPTNHSNSTHSIACSSLVGLRGAVRALCWRSIGATPYRPFTTVVLVRGACPHQVLSTLHGHFRHSRTKANTIQEWHRVICPRRSRRRPAPTTRRVVTVLRSARRSSLRNDPRPPGDQVAA
jgi:hypothetical protein